MNFMTRRNVTFTTIFMALGLLALSPMVRAVSPAPDGDYPGGNTAEGHNALFSLTSGAYNTSVGFMSLFGNTTGAFDTAIGAGALLANTGDQNTATGAGALLSNTTGTINTADGAFSLASNTTGTGNTASGAQALFKNITGEENTAIGFSALGSNSDGVGNTAVGFDALRNNISAAGNTAVGRSALASNLSGNQNTATGFVALGLTTTGSSNTAVGFASLGSNVSGGNNTAIGGGALATNASGSSNTAVGVLALGGGSGDSNTAMGSMALHSDGTGANNTAIGAGALANNTAGNNNIALGINAGQNVVTASDTICIGIAGVDVTDGCYIGHVFEEPLNPDNLPMAIDVNGKVGTLPSSRRFKDDIKPMDKTSEVILALKPVAFHYKDDKNCSPRFGLIAEEVAEVDPNLVARGKDGKPYTVRYDQVNAMLLNEFLKEHRKVQEQETTINELKKEIETVVARLKQQDAKIQTVSMQIEMSKPARRVAVNRP